MHVQKKQYLKGSATSKSEKHGKDTQEMPWVHTTVAESGRSFIETSTIQQNKKVQEEFERFLNKFVCRGESQPHYIHHMKGIHSSGASSHVLCIPYSHIREFSQHLAMTLCNNYNRLKKSLNQAARSLMKQSLQLESEPKVTLKILELPLTHQWLIEHLKGIRSVEVMKVYGHTLNTIYVPTPDYILVLEGIIWFIIMKHKSGFSWNGEFDIKNIEVINGNIFLITKPPKKFKVLVELIEAMKKDFLKYVELFLSQRITMILSRPQNRVNQVNAQFIVPYLHQFIRLLTETWDSKVWSNSDLLEGFRDLIRHHPFLKPPLVISQFLSGIHSACRAHDYNDPAAPFKDVMHLEMADWGYIRFGNSMINAVLSFKENKKAEAQNEEEAEDKNASPIPGEKIIWSKDLEAMVEFIRHLFNHGPDYSKEKRKISYVQGQDGKLVPYGENEPRKQLMKTLEETEVAAAVGLSKFICNLFRLLVEEKCISKPWILPMWKAYKNSFSSTPIDERAMEQWDKWWEPDEEDEDVDEDDEEQ